MIKQVIFSKTNSLDDGKQIILDFSKNINVIIGPKGGGKSTLFDLLAGLKENYISENVKDALSEYGLEFKKAIKFNNEEILSSSLSVKKTKEKDKDYDNRNDVISQDDKIKKNLVSASGIKKAKDKYIYNQISDSEDVSSFVLLVKDFYDSMEYLNDLKEKNKIIWSNTFKMSTLESGGCFKLLIDLDYKTIDINKLIRSENYDLFIQKCNDFLRTTHTIKDMVNNKSVYEDKQFVTNVLFQTDVINDAIKKLIDLISRRNRTLSKIQKAINSFDYAYQHIIEKIKQTNFSSDGLNSYKISALNYFKNFSQAIKQTCKFYWKIFEEDIDLNIKNKTIQDGEFKYEIKNPICLSYDLIIKCLKTVLYKPKKDIQKDISKWLKTLNESGVKPFDKKEIIKSIAQDENVKNKVKVFIDFGDELKDYDTLSLGQKSIYGLKYKFNRSLKEDLFLDQPEDNLDNSTITQEVLPLLSKKKDNQVFIVTHNANIGILSNPSQIIVANLGNKDEPYKISNIFEEMNKKSASYLEGGDKYLEKRYNKIIKNIKEN